MTEFTPNIFIRNLAAICREHPLAEKWLLAPNRRVGNQWVEQVARSGQPAVNLRVVTFRSLVLELSGTNAGKLISQRGAEILVSRILKNLREQGPRYFTTLEPYPSLVKALARSVGDLRAAGIKPENLLEGERGRGGEGEKSQNLKMEELADLLAGYEAGLTDGGYVDHGGLLTAVRAKLAAGKGLWPEGRLLLVPDDLDLGKPEQKLLHLLPTLTVTGLKPAKPEGRPLTDLARLAWMDAPIAAPPPLGDGTLEIAAAAGEINEVRMALRRILADGTPLDQVELLYTDRGTYLPLIFETLSCHFRIETGDLDSLPATFSEGIPSLYSRPGRALNAWALWGMEGQPAQVLAGMIREGLLAMDGASGQDDRAAAADLLTGLVHESGMEAALAALERASSAIVERPQETIAGYDDNGEEMLSRSLDPSLLNALRALLQSLASCSPSPDEPLADDPLPVALDAAIRFLETVARTAGEFDEYARTALVHDMRDARRYMEELGHAPDGDPLEWIISLIGEVRVAGSGPRPGRIHIAPMLIGGHSGRPWITVLGLDDGRLPGTDRQEPVLLDNEREEISGMLRLAGEDLRRREMSLAALAARALSAGGSSQNTLTLTCSLRDLTQDRDTFPGSSLVKAFRILKDPLADQEALLAYLSPPASFIEPDRDHTLDAAEWWTGKFTSPAEVVDAKQAFIDRFPHLGRGLAALVGKQSLAASSWDGMVGSLPPELDILSDNGPASSSNRLQALGACPLRYFFRYILDIESVDEEPPEPGKWLTAADKGSILHELFHIFMDRLIKTGMTPDFNRDIGELESILDGLLLAHEESDPPPSPHVRQHERAQMVESARIFLREEEAFTSDHEPLYTEASIGLPSTDLPTGLDHPEPVVVAIDQARRIRIRGRIDRIDRRRSDGCYVVTDYKSGSSWLYTRKDRFQEGRVVQHLLYILMADARLKETHALAAPVAAFRFLFPTPKTQGESVLLTREELEAGMEVLTDLCDLAQSGCFIPTDNSKDCKWCDYKLICGDVQAQARRIVAKLEASDERLDPMRKLRGYL